MEVIFPLLGAENGVGGIPQPPDVVSTAHLTLGGLWGLDDDPFTQEAILPALFLCTSLLSRSNFPIGGLDVMVTASSLPVGAGLGSSAAFSVALAAALIFAQRGPRCPACAETGDYVSLDIIPCACIKKLVSNGENFYF